MATSRSQHRERRDESMLNGPQKFIFFVPSQIVRKHACSMYNISSFLDAAEVRLNLIEGPTACPSVRKSGIYSASGLSID
ncbi:hypothetical protein MPC1_50012 [Methylocella tundrae]|nr:hypothetical protein MPC1_50012 [Methylocella tundrae]